MIQLFVNKLRYPYKVFEFKGGEVSVQLQPFATTGFMNETKYQFDLKILAHLRNSSDIMELLLLTNAVRTKFPLSGISLTLPYVPYARQDRVCASGEALSIKVFADLINSQNYDNVTIWDPHSDVTTALIDRARVVKAERFLDMAFTQSLLLKRDNIILVSPDAGAQKKILDVAQYLRIDKVVKADKVRNTKNGEITGTVVHSVESVKEDFLIVDDICDGGRTFIELAKVLRPLTSGNIFLYVTHGIFSAGLAAVTGEGAPINHVFTPNSFIAIEPQWTPYVTLITS